MNQNTTNQAEKLHIHTSSEQDLTFSKAIQDFRWRQAMKEEMESIKKKLGYLCHSHLDTNQFL